MLKQKLVPGLTLALVMAASACGPDAPEPGVPDAPDAPPTVDAPPAAPADLPAWYRLDGNQVEMDIVAGATPTANYWNFNGGVNGDMTISVPVGSQVTIRFRNDDPNMVHSIGVAPMTASIPATPPTDPVFDGGISSNADSMTESTQPGQSESFTFTADQPGEYRLLCYVPGHGVAGMWVRFNVGEEASVSGAPDIQISMD